MTDKKATIVIVDDDPRLLTTLSINFKARGYEVYSASTGAEGLQVVSQQQPDVVILDMGLPDMDGREVLDGIRGWSAIPVLILTARSDPLFSASALDRGADDYVTKPFSMEELLARVRSLVRRASADSIAAEAPVESKLSFEDLELDADTREVSRGGRAISLTRTEFALLQLLMENPRKVLSRNKILEEVWGYDFPTSGNALEVYIGYLRKKTEGEGDARLIHTVRGVGYVLRESNP